MDQNQPSSGASKMTRKTIIYVEEISDAEKDTINKGFKHYPPDLDTKVGHAITSEAPTDSPVLKREDLMPVPSPKILQRRGTIDRKAPSKGPKALAHGDDLMTIEQSLLYKTLRPIFLSMKIFGLFFISRKKTHKQGLAGFIRNCTALQAYCLFILVLLTVNFARSLPALESIKYGINSELFFKVIMIIFYYEAASRSFIALNSCFKKKGGLQDFYLSIDKYCYSDKIIPYEHSLKQAMAFYLSLSLLLTIGNVAVMFYGSFFGPPDLQESFDFYLVPFSPDMPGILAFQLFIILLTFINSAVALLSLSFYSITCFVLYKEFEYLCRTFAMKIKEDGTFSDDLEKFRNRHQKRCKLVEDADQLFKRYIANTYLTNIPLLCLLLYGILYTDDKSIVHSYINAYRLIYVLVQMMLLSMGATVINNQAHAPLADIYSIRVQTCTQERQLEVTMFLNKLTGTSIGLTAWDMFVISKPTVLTVFGMILTYFFLLMQFKNPIVPTTYCVCETSDLGGTTQSFQGEYVL